MKICAIRDEYTENRVLGYLFYYEKQKTFYIELDEQYEEKELPLFLASFARRGVYTIDPDWSLRFVGQRIIPADRQNLGLILKENSLKEYDEWKLLLLSEGRGAQDDCSVIPVKEDSLPEWLLRRRLKNIETTGVMKDNRILTVYRDGLVQILNLDILARYNKRLQALLSSEEALRVIKLLPGGYGVSFGGQITYMSGILREKGKKLPVDREDLYGFLQSSLMDTAEVCQELSCSRQYVNQLVQKRELAVFKESGNNRMYLRSAVEGIEAG